MRDENYWSILKVSILMLFLEMLLIRWIGTEVRIFAYLQNTILVTCFLAIGMGCFSSRKEVQFQHVLFPFLLIMAVFVFPDTHSLLKIITPTLSVLRDFHVWDAIYRDDFRSVVIGVTIGLSLSFVLLLLVWDLFVPFGRMLGSLLDDCDNIVLGYSANIFGSLLGIWLFTLFSYLWTAPPVWLLTALVLSVWLFGANSWKSIKSLVLLIATGACAAFVGFSDPAIETQWSPYQKLSLHANPKLPGAYSIEVNHTTYQGVTDLSTQAFTKHSSIYPAEMQGLTKYDLPFLLYPKAKKVLIVGAGAGNDAAGALRNGAEQIVAVEIDPAILDYGKRYHPEQPYASNKVRPVVDDARSFFATTKERFDIIIFGLLDAHTMTHKTNARLDHYVYTQESIEQAKSLLTQNGLLFMSFYAVTNRDLQEKVETPFIFDRIASVMKEVFDREPLMIQVPRSPLAWETSIFVAGNQALARQSIADDPLLKETIQKWNRLVPVKPGYNTEIATDDWPYIYLRSRQIPSLHYLLAVLLVLLFVVQRYLRRGPAIPIRFKSIEWHFFFLGAAFLLLEVHNVSKSALVLGNTWIVNAVIVTAVLLMILAANLVTLRFPRIPLPLIYGCLVLSCIALYFFDLNTLSALPYASKAFLTGTLTCTPMFFSGLAFIRSFAVSESKDHMLGINLIGSLVGGLLQSITFITGISTLLLIVGGFYCLAFFTRPQLEPPGLTAR